MAYDKYRSATELGTGSITAEHDGLWIGSDSSGTGGSTGDLHVKLAKDDTAVTFKGVPTGTLLPIEVKEIIDATTKCGDIVGLESGERWST
tara:strand:+ start:11907 stop:12179 length:273 start_codon:yes stop_codon:yes gene_type:complete